MIWMADKIVFKYFMQKESCHYDSMYTSQRVQVRSKWSRIGTPKILS